jgi:hypothetical protein
MIDTNTKIFDIKKKNFLLIKKYRNNFRFLFFKKKKYNKSFFNIVRNFKKFNSNKFFKHIEVSIQSILIKKFIIFSYSDFDFFLKNNFIFLNKKKINQKKKEIKKNDLLEIIVFKNYFIYLIRNIFSIIKLRNINFLKKKINPKNKIKSNNYFTKKIKVDFFTKDNQSNMFEIDFSTLSLFFLDSFITYQNLNFKTKRYSNFFYINYYK